LSIEGCLLNGFLNTGYIGRLLLRVGYSYMYA